MGRADVAFLTERSLLQLRLSGQTDWSRGECTGVLWAGKTVRLLPRTAPGDRRRHDELGHVLPIHSAARIMAASWFRQLGLRSAPVNKSFLLKKWYLDCVTTAGDAAMIYLADLSWRRLSIQYSSLLTLRAGEMQRKSSLCRRTLPARSESGIEVHAPQLGFRGTWRPLANAIKRKIFGCEDGTIDWQCFQPKAEVELCFASHQTITGWVTQNVSPSRWPLGNYRLMNCIGDDS
jgi:hypothetical protein